MNKALTGLAIAALALLASVGGNAATVTMIPSTLSPAVGDTFTVTVRSDVGNTLAATMILSFDATTVAFVGGALPATGPFSAANGALFTKNTPATATPAVFDIETMLGLIGPDPGSYDAAVLSFLVVAPGAASIWVWDDGGYAAGWFDYTTPNADYIPVDYLQAAVNGPSLPHPDYPRPTPGGGGTGSGTGTGTGTGSGTGDTVVPAPPAILLLATGLVALGLRRGRMA